MTTPATAPRDYVGEMDALIAQAIPGDNQGTFISAIIARDIILRLREQDPDLLDGWLRAYAEHSLTWRITQQARSARARARNRAPAVEFDTAAQGGRITLDAWLVVSDQQARRRVADMTAIDHRYVAHRHTRRGNAALALAAFHEAVAVQLGDRRTGDVYSEEAYAEMYQLFSA
jgi:hypothetical protein